MMRPETDIGVDTFNFYVLFHHFCPSTSRFGDAPYDYSPARARHFGAILRSKLVYLPVQRKGNASLYNMLIIQNLTDK